MHSTSVTCDRRDKAPRGYCSPQSNATASPDKRGITMTSISLGDTDTWQPYGNALYLSTTTPPSPFFVLGSTYRPSASPLSRFPFLINLPLLTIHSNDSSSLHSACPFPYDKHGVYHHPSANNKQTGRCPACTRNALFSQARRRAGYHSFPSRIVREHSASHALHPPKAQ